MSSSQQRQWVKKNTDSSDENNKCDGDNLTARIKKAIPTVMAMTALGRTNTIAAMRTMEQ